MERKQRYYKAVKPIEGGTIYKKLSYGYAQEIDGIKYFSAYPYKCCYMTEAKTGYGVWEKDYLSRAEDIKQIAETLPPVESYPTITEAGIKTLKIMHTETLRSKVAAEGRVYNGGKQD